MHLHPLCTSSPLYAPSLAGGSGTHASQNSQASVARHVLYAIAQVFSSTFHNHIDIPSQHPGPELLLLLLALLLLLFKLLSLLFMLLLALLLLALLLLLV
jgi:hypothetical protein